MRVLADEILIYFNCPGIRGDNAFPATVTFRVDQPLLDETSDGTGEVTLAMVELRRELRDRIAAFDSSEDLELDSLQHVVTQYEFYI